MICISCRSPSSGYIFRFLFCLLHVFSQAESLLEHVYFFFYCSVLVFVVRRRQLHVPRPRSTLIFYCFFFFFTPSDCNKQAVCRRKREREEVEQRGMVRLIKFIRLFVSLFIMPRLRVSELTSHRNKQLCTFTESCLFVCLLHVKKNPDGCRGFVGRKGSAG